MQKFKKNLNLALDQLKIFCEYLNGKFHFINKYIHKNPYLRLMRLDKPTGIYLCLFPALWTLILASNHFWQILLYCPLFIIGAIITRGAGCVINDMLDRKFDIQVARTKSRPLASGELSMKEAYWLLAMLALISLSILSLLPIKAILTGIISALIIAIYPLMKRITYYPQIYLGIAMNLGVFIAWYTVQTHFNTPLILIFVACSLWTIGYDTIYALQDKEDDLKAGVKSITQVFGSKVLDAVWWMYQTSGILMLIVGLNTHMNILYYFIVSFGIYQLYWQTTTLQINSKHDIAEKFKSNTQYGLIILAACLIGKI
jgi:4-hydroxybenzoate polyprenyltransferase